MPVSHFSLSDHEIINLSAMADFTLSAVRDIRLGLGAKLFDISETALTFRVKSVDESEAFFDKINASIQLLEGLSRLIMPFPCKRQSRSIIPMLISLPAITQHDTFYSQMLILQYHACRLLVIHHALREIRTAYERDRPQIPWLSAEVRGQALSFVWGYPALISAETVLSTFLLPSDLTLLSTAPVSSGCSYRSGSESEMKGQPLRDGHICGDLALRFELFSRPAREGTPRWRERALAKHDNPAAQQDCARTRSRRSTLRARSRGADARMAETQTAGYSLGWTDAHRHVHATKRTSLSLPQFRPSRW
jgi:hypothetical protein